MDSSKKDIPANQINLKLKKKRKITSIDLRKSQKGQDVRTAVKIVNEKVEQKLRVKYINEEREIGRNILGI